MKGIDYDICETQRRIFSYMARQGYDMKNFVEEYMACDFCRRAFDTIYSRFQLEDVGECMDFYMPEIEDRLSKYHDNQEFNPDVAGWIGFTYRQLYIETGVCSAELIKIVPFDVMCRYYPGLHTIDEANAVQIIINDHKADLKIFKE